MPKAATAVAAHFISKVLETAFQKKVIVLTFSFLKRGTKVLSSFDRVPVDIGKISQQNLGKHARNK